jgi:acyl-CoA oxidase
MINSPLLKANPSLYSFLPMFYMVWADDVLTPSEIKNIQSLINKQSWLKTEERELLLSYLNPAKPPSPNEIKSWLTEIKRISQELSPEMKTSLVDIGNKLAELNSIGRDEVAFQNAQQPLRDIEDALGIISRESAFHLASNDRAATEAETLASQKTFSVDKLRAILDGDQAALIAKVKTLLSDPEFKYLETGDLTEYREKVLHWCKILASQGYGNRAYPKEFGGVDDMEGYFTIMETLSYHDLSMVIKFGVQFGLFGMSIYFLGTEKHHKKYLADAGTLELPGCFAMTETGHGSNVKGIETTATYDHKSGKITIHTPNPKAQKEYIGNAALHGQMATVFAKLIIDGTDYGVSAFVVPLRDKKGNMHPGVTIKDCGRKMGLNGVDNGVIRFDNVVIPKESMLDRFASIDENGQFASPISSDNRRFFTMLGTLVGGRIGIPRSGLSATKSGLTIAIRYADGRKQFGPEGGSEVPILNYRTHQRRLMPLLSNAYALHFALQYLSQRFLKRTEEDMQEIEALAAGLKSWATWNATASLQECREALGGKGYLAENRIAALKNDTEIYTTFEGDNTVLMQLVAKSRLSEFRQEFGHMNLFGMLNYVTDQAKVSIQEMNPITIRNTDKEHLLDFEFHLAAFRYREKSILASSAKRLKHYIDQGMDSFDAFNQCQYHLVMVGHAYIERIILEQFQEKISEVTDEGSKQILTKLCQLFALSQIEKNKGWYLEADYMAGAKTKAIRQLVNTLCLEVRQNAVALTDAFGIPDTLLAAPIAVRNS